MKKKFLVALIAVFAVALSCVFVPFSGAIAAEAVEVDFTKAASIAELSAFKVGFDPKDNNDKYTGDSWVTYETALDEAFTLSADGLSVNTAIYSGDDVSENNLYVRYNAQKFKYFTAELVYSFNTDARNGWAGFMMNYTNFARKARWGDSPNGLEIFVQKEGKGTYSSSKLNNSGYTEGSIPENYTVTGTHTLKLVVNEEAITLYQDGTSVISISAAEMENKGFTVEEANIGFFFNNGDFTAKSFKVTPTLSKEEQEAQNRYLNNYDFTAMTSYDELAPFKAGIDPQSNNDKYTEASWVTYAVDMQDAFTLSENGITVNPAVYSGDDVSENNLYVRYNDAKYTYFKAELVYSYDNTDVNGWAGFMMGYTDYARKARWGDSPAGIEIFVQKGGKGTYSSAKLNNSNYTEGNAPADYTVAGEHTLSIVAVEKGITLYQDGVEVVSISKATMQEKGYTMANANVGFFFTNSTFTAKTFKISPLNAAGDVYQAVSGIEVEAAAEATQFAPYTINTTVLPATATVNTVSYILPEGASASGNTVYFTKAGEQKITVVSDDNKAITKEITVNVKADSRYASYSFTEQNIETLAESYAVTNGSAKDGAACAWNTRWNINADGSVTVKEKFASAVDGGYSLLYLKDIVNGTPIQDGNFELIFTVQSAAGAPNGWHGVGYAMPDRQTVPNQNGVSLFIQEEARKATIWGGGNGGVSGPYEKDSSYQRGATNLIKVKVYGGEMKKIEMYVNDMATPVVTGQSVNINTGDLAFFSTTIVTFGNIYYTVVDAEGNPFAKVYPESIEITNPITEGTVGEQYTLIAGVKPENVTIGGVLFQSSSALTATVNNEGVITFMNAGTVTITVTAKGDPSVQAEVTITVKNPTIMPESITFDATPETAEVGGTYMLFVTINPADTTDYTYTFSSSDESVATVDENGRLTYLKAGEVTITVTCNADETVSASFTITVTGGKEPAGNVSCGAAAGVGVCAMLALAIAAIAKKR